MTLTGAGGVGKTRLALEAAGVTAKAFKDGVWLVNLASVPEPSTLVAAVVAALRLPGAGTGPGTERLARHLARRRALLVMDNCEHLVDACAELAQTLLSACPELKILATSRQILGMTGEHVLTVMPLPPDEAAQLLYDRAASVQPAFAITDANRPVIDRLCRDLDGLPLAIELTACHLRTLTVAQISDRLKDRFTLLACGSRTAQPRQRTLRALIDWSYELCGSAEQLLWNRLSVFTGGFALDAAEEVCQGVGVAAHDVPYLLGRLVAQSVVLPLQDDDQPRYHMLETIREYGRARLVESGEERRVLRRHRDHFLALAESLALRWYGPGQDQALSRLRAEHGNLRTALEYMGEVRVAASPGEGRPARAENERAGAGAAAPDQADAQVALRLAAALRYHWAFGGFLTEGRRYFDRCLEAAPEPTVIRARALPAAAWTALLQGDHTAAARWLDEAETLGERLDDAFVRADVLCFRGTAAAFQGRLQEAAHRFEEAAVAGRAAGDESALPFLLFQLASTQAALGDPGAAETGRRAVAAADAAGERLCRSYALSLQGHLMWAGGDADTATAHMREALDTFQAFNDYVGTILNLETLAVITAAGGDHERAARLLGAVAALSRDIALTAFVLEDARASCERTVRAALGPTVYDQAVKEGSQYDSPKRAIGFALGPHAHAESGRAAPGPLTKRERQVAELVAQVMTNRQIASQLALSPRTVDTHVENIRAKLGFVSRAQIATWWLANGSPTP